jgi:hypothetical protein
VEVELNKLTETGATFKANGTVGNSTALSARIEIAYFNLAEKNAEFAEIDKKLIDHHKHRWLVLNGGRVSL